MNNIPNKKKQLNNKLIYPLLYQKKNKLSSKALSSQKNSIKKNNLENSKDPEELKKPYNNAIVNKGVKRDNKEEKISFTYIVQYAREKIKKEYCSPYIEKLVNNKIFNYLKEEEMPIYICFYKINNIFLNKTLIKKNGLFNFSFRRRNN